MDNSDRTIECIGDLLKLVDESGLQDRWGSHVRVWFRGHCESNWKLEPSIYRAGIIHDETYQILIERHMTQDFESYSAHLVGTQVSDAELYFIQQQHRMPTRLLDWTSNPLASLYFATLEPDDKNGEVFMLDSYCSDKGHVTVRHSEFNKAVQCIFDFTCNDWPKRILAVRPQASDARIIAQSGYFTFHPPGHRYVDIHANKTLRSYIIPHSLKKRIRKELELLNFNKFTVYGDLDHLAEWLRSAYINRVQS